ncbi:MAG: ABC transporter permease [Lachnospiraceae bacterium]|nr:ABC transporter permease [Lachnospiraceae bacterium]
MSKRSKSENIYSLKGFSEVFRFTVIQNLKNKAVLLELCFVILVLILMTPLTYIMSSSGQKKATKEKETKLKDIGVEKLYIYDKTDMDIDIEEWGFGVAGLKAEVIKADEVKVEGENDCLILIDKSEDGYNITMYYSDNTKLDTDKLQTLLDFASGVLDNKRMALAGLDDEKIALINKGTFSRKIEERDYISERDSIITDSKFESYVMSYVMIIFVVVTLVSTYILTSVSLEKTSKLAETVLSSVRPMALLAGKIIGTLALILVAMLMGILGSYITRFIMENAMGADLGKVESAGVDFSIFFSFGVKGVIIQMIGLLLAFAIFGTLAGLMGSTVNKTEDIQSANGAVMIISFIGYIGAFVLASKSNLHMLLGLVPPFSMFSAPILYLTGRMSLILLIASWAIQVVVLVAIMMLSARIYKGLLLSGNTIPGFKSIIKALKG